MTDKEIIRAWVKRREELLRAACKHSEADEMVGLLSYIDSMQEKPVSDKLGGINNALIQDRCVQEYPVCDDLEEEIGEFISASIVGIQYCRHAIVEWGKRVARHFTDWQKQQILKDAVDAEIGFRFHRLSIDLKDNGIEGFECGDKVKIIIINRTDL